MTSARSAALLLVSIGSILAPNAASLAAPPWKGMDLFKVRRVEADPEKSYALGEEQGPWMIMCATFSGDEADDQARELTQELRARYKLPAFTHEMSFDHSANDAKTTNGRFGPRKVKYRKDRIREIAVLVGDFPDDTAAHKTLNRVKRLEPECMDLEKRLQKGQKDSRSLGALRLMYNAIHDAAERDEKKMGPLGHAFVTTNPLLPDEYFNPKGLDKLVLEMNAPVKHSLLQCPGKYTVKVATFTGRVVLDQAIIEDIEDNRKKLPSQLAEAAEKAHVLTEELRKKGYEAYEFHDRYSSIVTVGSFMSVGTPRADGKIEIDPQVHAIIKTFGAEAVQQPGQSAQPGKPKQIAGIPLDIQPLMVEVPRRSISRDYERPDLSRF